MGIYDKIKSQITSSVKEAVSSANIKTDFPVPWDMNEQNQFWPPQEIDGERWDKIYPYRLVVVQSSNDSKYNIVSTSRGDSSFQIGKLPESNGLYALNQMTSQWVYVFPISFQQLNITDQYAIHTISTLKGVSEEHNGLKFKIISASGTVGVWPYRQNLSSAPGSEGKESVLGSKVLGSIFSGAVEAGQKVGNQLTQVANAFSGSHPAIGGANKSSEINPSDSSYVDKGALEGTGYYQIMLLGQFLERYVEAKKLPENKNWHLAIDMPKQNQSFLVTPVTFSLLQSAQKPMEYTYSFQLRAFRRITIDGMPSNVIKAVEAPSLNSNFYLKAIRVLQQCRSLMSSAASTIKAVRSDFLSVMDNLRQITLLVKDTAGVAKTIADLPRNIINDAKMSIINMKSDLSDAKNTFKKAQREFNNIGNAINIPKKATNLFTSTIESNAQSLQNSINTAKQDQINKVETNSVMDVFKHPDSYFDLLNSIDFTTLTLTPQQQQIIDQESQNAQNMTSDDINKIKQEIASVALDLTNSFGASNPVFAQTYGRPAPQTRSIPMTLDEDQLVSSLYDVIQVLDQFTQNKAYDDGKTMNPMQYVGSLANDLGITFTETTNKKRVPVPFGLTIEEIALRFLGNQDRWLEISTLNSLQSPYIDEVGYQLPLLSNASGRQFNINNSDNQLWVGQAITLGSNTVPRFMRKITSIDGVDLSNVLVTVDGIADLDNLKLGDSAYLLGYLKGTINSQNLIWIPTSEQITQSVRSNLIPFLPKDDLNAISGVDFLLTEAGDIAINSAGDFRLASGMTNLIQAIRLKISTERGRLLRHQEYGLDLSVGQSLADINVQTVAQQINATIAADPRFAGVEKLNIQLDGPKILISMEVIVANRGTIVPISFQV